MSVTFRCLPPTFPNDHVTYSSGSPSDLTSRPTSSIPFVKPRRPSASRVNPRRPSASRVNPRSLMESRASAPACKYQHLCSVESCAGAHGRIDCHRQNANLRRPERRRSRSPRRHDRNLSLQSAPPCTFVSALTPVSLVSPNTGGTLCIRTSLAPSSRKGPRRCQGSTSLHACTWKRFRPLFIHRDGKPQTRANLSKRLQNRLSTRAGLQGTYSGHSFRIGAATLATRAGIPDHIIKILGRYLGRFIHSHTCTHGGQCTFFYNAIAVIYVQPYCFVLSSLRVLHRNNTHNI